MSSEDFMQNRRKFIKRSALGAGGVLFLPSLLSSCTDHNIPDPQGPVLLPLLGDDYGDNFNWNDDGKIVVKTALSYIPVAGEMLSGLVDIFWPNSKPEIWPQIRAEVEALVQKDISDYAFSQVQGNLDGLRNVMLHYLDELKNGEPGDIKAAFNDVRNDFDLYEPNFRDSLYAVPLLPLFGQFATMYLGLLRDGALFGASWGMTDGDVKSLVTWIDTKIGDYYGYTADTYNKGRGDVANNTKYDPYKMEPFKSINTYDRQMTLTVLDFMNSWPYFSVSSFPTAVTVELKREIYSDPYGSSDNSTTSGGISFTPWGLMNSSITVWASDRVDAVQSTYTGIDTVSQTPRWGVPVGGKVAGGAPSTANTINISPNNPITKVRALTGKYPFGGPDPVGPFACAFQFQFNDNTTTKEFGSLINAQAGTTTDTGMFGYPGEALTLVFIHGGNKIIGGADCVVFGFTPWESPQTTLRGISALYVKSPTERSEAEFDKAFPKLGISAGSITEELKTARKEYWASINARAKQLK